MKFAVDDTVDALSRFRVWSYLGFLEVRQKYQRSVLGPWWVSISMLIFIGILGTVFSRVFGTSLNVYMPYFSTGYLLWIFISSCITESVDVFRGNSGFIKQIRLPYSIYIFKFLSKHVIIFFHNFLVVLLVLFYFKVPFNLNFLYAIPAFVFLCVNLYWICMCVAIVSTRFRDMVPVINSCIQILFLATPISWNKDLVGVNSKIVLLNPFTYLIDSVRSPLLGNEPSFILCFLPVCFAFLGVLFSLVLLERTIARLPFWVD